MKEFKGRRQVRRLINEEIASLNKSTHSANEEKIIINVLINESRALKRAGYSRQQINEGLFDMISGLMGSAGGGLLGTLKETIVAWILQKIGIDPKGGGMTGAIGCALTNALGEVEMADLKQIVSGEEGVCMRLTDLAMDGVLECLTQEKFVNPMMDKLLGDGASSSTIGKVFSEMIGNFVSQEVHIQAIEDSIGNAICNMDFSEIVEKIPGAGSITGMFSGADEAAAQ